MQPPASKSSLPTHDDEDEDDDVWAERIWRDMEEHKRQMRKQRVPQRGLGFGDGPGGVREEGAAKRAKRAAEAKAESDRILRDEQAKDANWREAMLRQVQEVREPIQGVGEGVLFLHFMICHSKKWHRPRTSSCHKVVRWNRVRGREGVRSRDEVVSIAYGTLPGVGLKDKGAKAPCISVSSCHMFCVHLCLYLLSSNHTRGAFARERQIDCLRPCHPQTGVWELSCQLVADGIQHSVSSHGERYLPSEQLSIVGATASPLACIGAGGRHEIDQSIMVSVPPRCSL